MNSGVSSWNQLINRIKDELPREFSEETEGRRLCQFHAAVRSERGTWSNAIWCLNEEINIIYTSFAP